MNEYLKLMVTLATKKWAGPVKFDPGQVKIMIDYIRKEIFRPFLGDNFSLKHCHSDWGSGIIDYLLVLAVDLRQNLIR